MLRKNLASSRLMRVGVFGLVTVTTPSSAQRQRRGASLTGIGTMPAITPSRRARELQPGVLLDHRRRQFRRDADRDQSRRDAPPRLADQDHDALSAVRAPRCRQDEARHRDAGIRARLRPGSDQARPAARPDHPGRRRHQGTGHALRQRRRRRDRRSHRRQRRRFRQDDDAQGARARHEPHRLSQRLRPSQRRAGDDGARSIDRWAARSRTASRATTAISRPRPSTFAARRSAVTITCSAASRASTASRPATPAPPASIS